MRVEVQRRCPAISAVALGAARLREKVRRFERMELRKSLKRKMVRNVMWNNDGWRGIGMKRLVDCFERHSHH